ncbi:xanthine dehydrogenase/oxidase-like, partial [Amphiura filiformis]|uniref:xanthine dehydrogenase/oxidase-like n=1 Tax=Amphiura filiformis TaxID=82378 RepID=UPI003B20F7CE
ILISSQITNGLDTLELFTKYDPSQDIIFPPELLTIKGGFQKTSWFRNGDVAWSSIGCLEELLELKSKYPGAPIIAGNTALGIQKKFTGVSHPVILAPIHVHELQQIKVTDDGLEVGSMVTVSKLFDVCLEHVTKIPDEKRRSIDALLEILARFAGEQIRNVATIGGHLRAAQPHSDLNSFFLASRCSVTLAAHKGVKRTRPLSGDFFPSRWKTDVAADEVIVNISIPFNKKDEYINVYKVSRRNHVDTAIVNTAFRLQLDEDTKTIQDICLVYGGVAATTKIATVTANRLIGKKWNKDILAEAYDGLVKELALDPGAPGGMVEYRHSLILSCFFKFYIDVVKQAMPNDQLENPATLKSVLRNFDEEFPSGSQVFQPVPDDQPAIDPIGRPIVHAAALQQTTGKPSI